MTQEADVCLILEGTYPFVPGGVSGWTHELIQMHPDLTFALVALLPQGANGDPVYELPKNVVSLSPVFLQDLPAGALMSAGEETRFFSQFGPALHKLLDEPLLANLKPLQALLTDTPGLGHRQLLNHRAIWNILRQRYDEQLPNGAFLDYFWSWRALLGGLYSVLLAPLPKARLYHALCTGYAGLMLARARVETGRPCLVTEHGIYTNERRIEIAGADWLDDERAAVLDVSGIAGGLSIRDFWVQSFAHYSRLTYEAADSILTLYEDNQDFQRLDGAPEEKLQAIPNGIDVERYACLPHNTGHPPTVALIGRVVPIKDIKTFIRAIGQLRDRVPNVRALILGGEDEAPPYAEECRQMVHYLGLEDCITFTGKVKVLDYLPNIDVIALTSISEAQPLVILEAGAAGIPTVATDVGSCREIIMGGRREKPSFGAGGAITPLADPAATAAALERLLTDEAHYNACSNTIRQRVTLQYHKKDQLAAYDALYRRLLALTAIPVSEAA